jgi:tRNA 2-thiouridine synthesizing protein A
MSKIVDARVLSCPQPVVLTNKMMKDMRKGIFEVLVDTDTSKENVSRLAQQMGWDCEVKQTGNDYVLVLKKGEEDDLSR